MNKLIYILLAVVLTGVFAVQNTYAISGVDGIRAEQEAIAAAASGRVNPLINVDEAALRAISLAKANEIRAERIEIILSLSADDACGLEVNLMDESPTNMSAVTKTVTCTVNILVRTLTRLMEEFGNLLTSAVAAILILYIIIYGLRVAMLDSSVRNAKQFFTHIAFVAVIAYLLIGVGGDFGFVNIYTDVLLAGQLELITWFLDFTGVDIQCEAAAATYTNPLTAKIAEVFRNFDCSISSLVTFKQPDFTGAVTYAVANTAAAVAAGAAVAAVPVVGAPLMFTLCSMLFFKVIHIGGTLLIFILTALITLLAFIVKILLGFIYSVAVLGITMVFAPIFIPCILFKATKPIFDSWLNLVISYTLQPVIIVTSMSFILILTGDLLEGIQEDVTAITVQENIINKQCLEDAEGFSGWIASKVVDKTCDYIAFNGVVRETIWAIFIALLKLILLFLTFNFISTHIAEFAREISGGGYAESIFNAGFNLAQTTGKETMDNLKTVISAPQRVRNLSRKATSASKRVARRAAIVRKRAKIK